MAFNLSRSIFIEVCESAFCPFSISSLLCLFRFGEGLEVELEPDDRSERFDMRKDGRASNVSSDKVQWYYMVLRRHHRLNFEGSKMARRGFSQLGNHRARKPRPTAMIPQKKKTFINSYYDTNLVAPFVDENKNYMDDWCLGYLLQGMYYRCMNKPKEAMESLLNAVNRSVTNQAGSCLLISFSSKYLAFFS